MASILVFTACRYMYIRHAGKIILHSVNYIASHMQRSIRAGSPACDFVYICSLESFRYQLINYNFQPEGRIALVHL